MTDLKNYVVRQRRHLHEYPEIGFKCEKTSAYLEAELKKLGVDKIERAGEFSLVATVYNGSGRIIGLRADFDALNIKEETDLSFKSKHVGTMHACGHDAHTAMLLGACKYLVENKDEWSGQIKFIFQEAEEGPDPGGAYFLVNSGKLSDVDEFFALHVSPEFLSGDLAINYGNALASADMITVTFKGLGAHAAYPHLGIDPIVMQADFITKLQSIISRRINPFATAVVTIGEVNAGTASNIIPETACLKGTVRTFSEDVRILIEKELDNLAKSVAIAYSGGYELIYQRGYDATINTDESVDKIIEVAKSIFSNTIVLEEASMGAEDFSKYINLKKGAIAWLGVGHKEKQNFNIHNSKFDLNEEALIKGAELFINIVKKG